jgi:hypothetical protein
MSHLQLMQEAAPIFKANSDGGVYLMTSSVAVSNLPNPNYRWIGFLLL